MNAPHPPALDPADTRDDFRAGYWLVAWGWLPMYLASAFAGLPTTFLLKEQLLLSAPQMASFAAITNIPSYLKPAFGIFSDAFPLWGTRRRHYLIVSTLLTGLTYLVIGFTPLTFGRLLWLTLLLMFWMVLLSTVMGGLMTDVAQRHNATGRMGAQRVFIGRLEALFSGPVGALLARGPFWFAMLLSGLCYLGLAPFFWRRLKEPPVADVRQDVLKNARRSLRDIGCSSTLWRAAALLVLVMIAPGFGTPMLFYQTDVLHFDKQFIGNLGFVGGAFGLLGAALYSFWCRKYPLRTLLTCSILVHGLGTLLFLLYRDRTSAIWITAVEGVAQTLALLPLYDLCARATPRGSEALGYSLMMSVWNLTNQLSNLLGSYLYDTYHLTFMQLIWLNAGTTLLTLIWVPLLPAVLANRREGESAAESREPGAVKPAQE